MNFNSKKTSLLILGITSLAWSRTLFALFNDPEGPNLLIVTVTAAIIYALSFAAYTYYPSTEQHGLKKLLSLIFFQMIVVAGFYFFLN